MHRTTTRGRRVLWLVACASLEPTAGGTTCAWDGTAETCHTRVHDSVVFLGDSTMSRLAKAYKARHRLGARCTRTAGRCNLAEYLNITKGPWVAPPPTCGPTLFGLTHPWCSDCSGCNAFLCGNATRTVEYLPVEYACDVEMQTATHVTTQAVVAHYLQHRRVPLLTCVANAGIHDERLGLNASESYSLFVRQYMALLVKACARIVWLTTSAARTDADLQKNWHMRAQNARVTAEMPAYVNIIDVFNASHSGPFSHADNVHMNEKYYETLARTFTHAHSATRHKI